MHKCIAEKLHIMGYCFARRMKDGLWIDANEFPHERPIFLQLLACMEKHFVVCCGGDLHNLSISSEPLARILNSPPVVFHRRLDNLFVILQLGAGML